MGGSHNYRCLAEGRCLTIRNSQVTLSRRSGRQGPSQQGLPSSQRRSGRRTSPLPAFAPALGLTGHIRLLRRERQLLRRKCSGECGVAERLECARDLASPDQIGADCSAVRSAPIGEQLEACGTARPGGCCRAAGGRLHRSYEQIYAPCRRVGRDGRR